MRLLFVAPPGDETSAVHAMQAAGKRADQQQMEVVERPHIYERFHKSDGTTSQKYRGTTMIPASQRKTLYPFTLLLLLLIAACSTPTASPSPTAAPTAATSTTPPLTDDFEPPNPAWARFETAESTVHAQAGELYLEDHGKGIGVYAPLAGKTYTDVVTTVQVRHVQGTLNNWMGVICRQQDEENYYLLAISADGFYLIMLVDDGAPTPLVGPETSDSIRTGKARNNLEVRCVGDTLSLSVNGERLATHTDDTLREAGAVALFADAVERGETAVTAFDNFSLSQP